MKSSRFDRNLTIVVGLSALTLVLGAIGFEYFKQQPNMVRCAVQPGDADAYLGGDVRTLTAPHTIEDNFLFKETVSYADGGKRIVKTVYDNRMPFLVSGNVPYVLYEYFRTDGTLEKSTMVFPETSLGASVYCKTRERTYGKDGKTELESRYIREDGTLGTVSDQVNGTFTQYRADGKRLRSVQQRLASGDYQTTYYRLDGATVWWVSLHSGNSRVFFDMKGNQVKKEFKSESLTGSFSMGPGSAPIPYAAHSYLRADGTVEYKQTWYAVYEGKDYFTGLSQVELYGSDGKTVTTRISLELRHLRRGLFVKTVELFNPDGSKLVRTYRSPGSRISEETFDAAGKSIKKENFSQNDKFVESFDNSIFDGFGVNNWGEYDTDQHDI